MDSLILPRERDAVREWEQLDRQVSDRCMVPENIKVGGISAESGYSVNHVYVQAYTWFKTCMG